MLIIPILLPKALGGGHLTLKCTDDITAGEFKHQIIEKINNKRLADLNEQNYKLAKLPLGSEADDSILEDPEWAAFKDDVNMLEQCAEGTPASKLCFAVTLQLIQDRISAASFRGASSSAPRTPDMIGDQESFGFETESNRSLLGDMDEYLRNRVPAGSGGDDEETEAAAESEAAEFTKLKQDSRRAREIGLELAAIEKFIVRFRKQASNHVSALKSLLDATKAQADTFKEFYHFTRSDPFMSKVCDEFSSQTLNTAREMLRQAESELEEQVPFYEQWTREVEKTKTHLRLREASKRRYIHYISKLATLAEKKNTGLSGKKQTQLKRNRLKLAHAKQAYDKCCSQTWAAFDVCWDCQFTQVNPLLAQTLGHEVSRFGGYQSSLTQLEDSLRMALHDSFTENNPKIQAHVKAAEIQDEPQPLPQFDPVELEAEQQRMSAVRIEYDLHDMLATVLDGDITVAIQTIADDELCSRMPIVGCVLASFPRRETIEALVARAVASPSVSQAVGCLNACMMVRPPKLLADVPASRGLADFFLNFHTTVALAENCVGMDFKLPPNVFHPFQDDVPIRRLVIIKSFVSNARPLLLAAYSEYEELAPEERTLPSRTRGSGFGLRDLASRAASSENSNANSSPSRSSVSLASGSPRAPPPRAASLSVTTSLRSISPQRDSISGSPRQPPDSPPKRNEGASPAALRRKPAPPTTPRPSLPPELPPVLPSAPEIVERKGDEKSSENQRKLVWWENLQAGRMPDMIFKYGDDLRTDQAVQHLFRLMNHLWKSQKLEHKGEAVEAHVYKVQALSSRMGLVEFVPGCIPLSALTRQTAYVLTEAKVDRIVVTSVAGYLAAFVLGIKDRHSDNILIMEDATVFHIDFGHVLGRGVTIDTGPFAITPEFKDILEQWFSWHSFIEVCEKAFLVMRLHADVVAEFATLLLHPIFPDTDIAAFVKKKLMVDMPLLDATLRLRKMVVSAPANYKTRLKNFVHGANSSYQTLKTALS